ncbi:MAG: hypothetical protein ACQEQ8_11090 [Pseudomonadota bacterium]
MRTTFGCRAIQKLKQWVTLSGGLLLAAACSQPQEPVNLAGNSWLGYQPLFIYQELDSDKSISSHLKLHLLPATSNVVRLMAEGQLDGGLLTLDETLLYQQDAEDPLCVAKVIDISLGADALIMQPNWRTNPEPLKIAHEMTTVGSYMLDRATEHGVFEGRKIETTAATPNMQVELLETKQVDGVISFYPTLDELKQLDAEVIFDSSDISGEIIDVLAIKQSVWEQHHGHIDAYIQKAWDHTVSKIRARDNQVMQLIAANTKMSPERVSAALAQLKLIGATEQQEFDLEHATATLQKYLLDKDLLNEPVKLDYCQAGSR